MAKVCTAWRDFILGSRYLIGDCKYFWLNVSPDNLEEAIEFLQCGFGSILVDISIVEGYKNPTIMDTMGFVRDHVKDKTTALTAFQIDVNDLTNIEAWSEILANSPEASTFDITFKQSKLDVQTFAERFWKVLLAVFYCNEKDKTLTISDSCVHHDGDGHAGHQLKVADWSFTKNEHKRYRNVQNPGTIKELDLPDLCPLDNSFMSYTAPIWDQVVIDRTTIQIENSFSFIDFDLSQFTTIQFKCVRLQFHAYYPKLTFPSAIWTYFSKCERLELYFTDINIADYKVNHKFLKLIKHPNLHVILGEPIRVSDANPLQARTKRTRDTWDCKELWTLFDVENFVNRIAVLSIKSLTYTLSEVQARNEKPPTVTFNCDEKFPFSFMDFLETQRIYCGYKSRWIKSSGEQDFFTLESAKASFPA